MLTIFVSFFVNFVGFSVCDFQCYIGQITKFPRNFQWNIEKYLRNSPQIPPSTVVIFEWDVPSEHGPAPLINKVAKRQESDLHQGLSHEVVNVSLWNKRILEHVNIIRHL